LVTTNTLVRFEDFQANPFWTLFYENPTRYAFETEITFLLQHYNQIKDTIREKSLTCFDFSILLDRAYVDVTLQDKQKQTFLAVWRHVWTELGPPQLLVHLQCSADEEFRRIQTRARSVEAGIEIGFLEALNASIRQHVAEFAETGNVLEVDSEARDFAHDDNEKRQVVAEVIAALPS